MTRGLADLVDTVVKSAKVPGLWHVEDLLGREVGTIMQDGTEFMVCPREGSVLSGIERLHRSLNDAIKRIATQARGRCRLLNARSRSRGPT